MLSNIFKYSQIFSDIYALNIKILNKFKSETKRVRQFLMAYSDSYRS